MAETIDQTYVDQFETDVIITAQQKQSRLRMCVMNGTQVGERKFVNRIGSPTAHKKLSRGGDTQYDEVDWSRRMVTLEDYEWAKLFDKEDSEKMLIDAANPYTQAGARAMGKAFDDEIIAAMIGNAYSGKSGGTTVALPDTQKLVAHTDSAVGTPTRMNVDTLMRIKGAFLSAEVDIDGDELFIAMNARQMMAMLRQTEVNSSDYNSIQALVQGKIDTFAGFKFIHTERIAATSGYYTGAGAYNASAGTAFSSYDTVLAWAKSGMHLSIARDVTAKVDILPTKSYSKQVYLSMGIGATRLEEEKVIACYAKTS